MTYMPRPQPPRVSAAQTARNRRWWEWQRKRDAILREAFAAFKRDDTAEFLRLDAEAKALPEPDIFNG